MHKKLNIRCRHPKGQFALENLHSDSTFNQLKEQVELKTGISRDAQTFKSGYPPKLVFEHANHDDTLATLGITSGETIIVDGMSAPLEVSGGKGGLQESGSKVQQIPPQKPCVDQVDQSLSAARFAVRRVVPSDNSCLFASIAYCLEGTASRKRMVFDIMRSMVSDFISAHPDGYNPVVLGCPSIEQYCKFICKRDSWGGAIELSIFSELYEIQICAWDIMTCRMDTYGLDKDYKLRIFVLYDGVHYDPLALSPSQSDPEGTDITIFRVDDQDVVQKMGLIVKELHTQRKYTDLTGCTLMCGICFVGLKGQKEAQEHAQKTGHVRFTEAVK